MDTATIITALGGLLTVVSGIILGLITAKSNAQRAEADSLRATIDTLQEECKDTTQRNQAQRAVIDQLQAERDNFRERYYDSTHQIRDCNHTIERLSRQLTAAGIPPDTGPLKGNA